MHFTNLVTVTHRLASQSGAPYESDQLDQTSDQQQDEENDVASIAPLLKLLMFISSDSSGKFLTKLLFSNKRKPMCNLTFNRLICSHLTAR